MTARPPSPLSPMTPAGQSLVSASGSPHVAQRVDDRAELLAEDFEEVNATAEIEFLEHWKAVGQNFFPCSWCFHRVCIDGLPSN